MREEIIKAIKKATDIDEIHLEVPEIESHGDYSCNVAMRIASKTPKSQNSKTPKKIAEKIVEKLKKDKKLTKTVGKIEVAGPGFINFWLKKEVLIDFPNTILKDKGKHGSTTELENTC